jgi:hypothetical protein
MRMVIPRIAREVGIEAWHFDVRAVKSIGIEPVLVQKEAVLNCLLCTLQ